MFNFAKIKKKLQVTKNQLNQLNSACGVEKLVTDLNKEEKMSSKSSDSFTTHHKGNKNFLT